MDASNGNAVEDMSKSGAPQRAPLDAESSRQTGGPVGNQTGRLITGLIFAVVVMLFVKAAASAGAGL